MNRKLYEKRGRRAEFFATLYLRLKGYRILARRFKCRAGEIDIIAKRRDILAIIEVKSRPTLRLAEESLSYQGEKRIIAATDSYISRHPQMRHLAIRFDAIFVVSGWKIYHQTDLWRDGFV